MSRRQAEFDRQRAEREERINQIIHARTQERETIRKKIFFVRTEEERLKKLREEEEARKREEAERQKKEEAERKAKLDEIFERQKQRERELEEKERLRREELLGRSTDRPSRLSEARPLETVAAPAPAPAPPPAPAPAPAPSSASAATLAPVRAKYVPPKLRQKVDGGGQAPPPESDRWGGRSDDRPPQSSDRWRRGGPRDR